MVVEYADQLHHATTLEQTKKQALVFLHGLGREIRRSRAPFDERTLGGILSDAVAEHEGELGFSVTGLRVFDGEGKAVSDAIIPQEAPITTHHQAMMRHMHNPTMTGDRMGTGMFPDGRHYMGWDITEGVNPETGSKTMSTELVIPLRVGEKGNYALSMGLDLGSTVQRLEMMDEAFGRKVAMTVAGAIVVVFFVVWWVLNRQLIRPIQDMSAVTTRIAEGDLSPRASGNYVAEIGRLGKSVNFMADSIDRLFREQEEAYLQSLQSLARALEAKDPYTAKHSARVAKFAVLLGRHIGLGGEDLELLKRGALMHDLGKIGIPDAILNKPAALTDEEFEEMKSHPVRTAAIMAPLKRFKAFLEIAAWHHERWDGKGYPDGYSGEEIPLLARIVSIADTWDAMTGDRVYRKGIPEDEALAILAAERDSGQWDPDLIDSFVLMMRTEAQAEQGGEAA